MKQYSSSWKLACFSACLLGLFSTFAANKSEGQSEPSFGAQVLAAKPQTYLNFNDTTTSFKDEIAGVLFVPSSNGTSLPQQPGFDSTAPSNKSASFAHGAYLSAGSNVTDDFEWFQPFSILIQIDRLEYAQTGTMYFVTKGNVGSVQQPWFSLSMHMNAGQAQLCFTMNGVGGNATNPISQPSVCTHPGIDTFANGFNYDIIATNDGTGSPNALQLYVNGLQPPYLIHSNNALYNFGAVVLTLGSSGKGYGNTTSFQSIGGGPNCSVSGTLNAQNGLPKTVSYTSNWGCTSLPTIELGASAGTGATISTRLFGAEMSTASSAPIIIAGALYGGQHLGIEGTATGTMPQFIDEFAVFPRVLSSHETQSLFYQTKFYQGLLKVRPTVPPIVVFDNDGCADSDNIYSLALAIAAEKLGYISIAGAVDTDGSGPSMAMYRQMLNEAGLTNAPVAVPSSTAITSNLCTVADADVIDAKISQSSSGYIRAAKLYRAVLAKNPNEPVYVILGGSFRGVSDLMQSGSDEISELTGAELLARNAENGGAIFAQGLGCCGPFTGDNSLEDWSAGQYVVEHNGKLPIYWYGGSPQNSGPGVLATRAVTDPVYIFANHVGTDIRPAWDSLAMVPFLSPAFAGGVTATIRGNGTAYPDVTTFTSAGGGPNCHVTGTMLSSGGIPLSIRYEAGTYAGLGSGCISAPSILLSPSAGNGAVLTAVPTMSCGTVSITGQHGGSTSASTCSQHYFLPYSSLAAQGGPIVLTWFLNSLIDPMP